MDEPLLVSILQQVQFARFKPELNQVWIDLDQSLSFFKDIIQDQRLVWLPKLQAVFGEHMSLEINLVRQVVIPELVAPVVNSGAMGSKIIDLAQINSENIVSGAIKNLNSNNLSNINIAVSKHNNKTLDFTNQARWPKVKLILDFFPGTLSEILE